MVTNFPPEEKASSFDFKLLWNDINSIDHNVGRIMTALNDSGYSRKYFSNIYSRPW